MKKVYLVLAVQLAQAFYPLHATSQQATVYKSGDAIILYGITPNTTVNIDVTKPVERGAIANSCGVLLVRSSESFSVDGVTIDPNSNLVIRDLPKTCDLAGYPTTFRTSSGAIAITSKNPSTAYTIKLLNHKAARQILSNDCGFVRLNESQANKLNLPTITGSRADFTPNNFTQGKPLLCVKGAMYIPAGFNLKTAVASAGSTTTSTTTTIPNSSTTTSTNTTVVSSQTAQPTATKNTAANKLIISSVPPGTYTVKNAANPAQSKTYTVTGSSSCFVVERSQLGNASNFIISRQGLTFPVSWSSVSEVSAIPSC